MQVVGTTPNWEEGMKNEELVRGNLLLSGHKKIHMEEVQKNEGFEVRVQLKQVELMDHS